MERIKNQVKQCLYCNMPANAGEICTSCELDPPKEIFEKKTCPYCGYDYTPIKEEQPTCRDPQCKKEHRIGIDYRKVRRACKVCDRDFLPTKKNQEVCSRFKCEDKLKVKKTVDKRETKSCPECGKEFKKFGNQATCGEKICKDEHVRKLKSESWRRAKHTRRLRLKQSGGVIKMPIVDWMKEQDGRGNLEAVCAPCHDEAHREINKKLHHVMGLGFLDIILS